MREKLHDGPAFCVPYFLWKSSAMYPMRACILELSFYLFGITWCVKNLKLIRKYLDEIVRKNMREKLHDGPAFCVPYFLWKSSAMYPMRACILELSSYLFISIWLKEPAH